MKFSTLASSILGCLLSASCTLAPKCWSGGQPLRPTERQGVARAVADFGDTSNAVVYRGLAHPEGETRLYKRQLARGGWVEIDGFKFFEEPIDVPGPTIDKVLRLYKWPVAHQAWGPKDSCPGFHPDYAIVWTSGEERRVLQLCYGCHEWKFFGPGGSVLTDISEVAYFGPLTETWLPKETR